MTHDPHDPHDPYSYDPFGPFEQDTDVPSTEEPKPASVRLSPGLLVVMSMMTASLITLMSDVLGLLVFPLTFVAALLLTAWGNAK